MKNKTRVPLTEESISKAKAALAAMPQMPANQGMTVKDAIRQMRSEIGKLQRRGYSSSEIAKQLTECGVTVTGTSLARYMNSRKRRAKAHPENAGREAGSKTGETSKVVG